MQQVDISAVGVTSFEGPEGKFDVEVFDSADEYVKLMKWVQNMIPLWSICNLYSFTKNIFLLH